MIFTKFFVPYKDDERMIYAAEYLSQRGFTETNSANNADFILLPIPVKKYMIEEFENKIVFYGAGDFKGYDYNKNDAFLLKNAYLTAEGAIALYKEKSDISLYGANVLIVGYGRIAKVLHKALNALGSNVTICSRSGVSKADAMGNIAHCIDFRELAEENKFDVIFNTVPNVVFTKEEIDHINDNTLFIDLASFPGGIDTHYAKFKKINVIDGKALPSRYSKKSAGYLIGETVIDMIKEGIK